MFQKHILIEVFILVFIGIFQIKKIFDDKCKIYKIGVESK